MKDTGIWEPFAVKSQTIKTAVESAAMLLRIDEIVSGTHKKEKKAPGVSDREKAAQAEGVDGAELLQAYEAGQIDLDAASEVDDDGGEAEGNANLSKLHRLAAEGR